VIYIPHEAGLFKLQVVKRSDSKVLERSYVELRLDGRAGKITRKEAIAAVAQELGVSPENVGVVRLEGQAGTTDVVGRFHVYSSAEIKKRVHPRYLEERVLTKNEREKLKQERKKAATPAPAPEAKK
jgi:ribosomal protein S24E